MHMKRASGGRGYAGMTVEEQLRYSEEVRQLREENRFLREAAKTFGELAERLSVQIHEARRRERDTQQTVLPAAAPKH